MFLSNAGILENQENEQNLFIIYQNILIKCQKKNKSWNYWLGLCCLPLAIKFSLSNIKTIGFDRDKIKVKKLIQVKVILNFFK